ncbi:response regulator [Rapidithrix thailandica]|uniref:Response regulator n=1 Tax=Rapidithrix thailandica TaxID=413964 RepID=A0AAW9RWG3_9BACT
MKKLGCILIVDDDDTSNFVTKLMLDKTDAAHIILMARNGKEAVNYLEENKNNFPDLILLDINMPIMNGFDFLEYWEKKGMTSNSKIVMFSTSIREEDKTKAEQFYDVISYIEKPLNEKKIAALFKEI